MNKAICNSWREGSNPTAAMVARRGKEGRLEEEGHEEEGEEVMAKRGLYANINAKKKAGKKMRKKGAKGAPTDKAFRDSAKTAKKRKR